MRKERKTFDVEFDQDHRGGFAILTNSKGDTITIRNESVLVFLDNDDDVGIKTHTQILDEVISQEYESMFHFLEKASIDQAYELIAHAMHLYQSQAISINPNP